MDTHILPSEIWTLIALNDYFVFRSLYVVDENLNKCMNNIKDIFILKYPIEHIDHSKKSENYTSTQDLLSIIRYDDENFRIQHGNHLINFNLRNNITFKFYQKYNMLVAYVSKNILFIIYDNKTIVDLRNDNSCFIKHMNFNDDFNNLTNLVVDQIGRSRISCEIALIYCRGEVVPAIMLLC